MKIPNFDEAAMEFVREHKFSMPLQDVKAAMEIGASLMTAELIKEVSTMNDKMRKERG